MTLMSVWFLTTAFGDVLGEQTAHNLEITGHSGIPAVVIIAGGLSEWCTHVIVVGHTERGPDDLN